MDPMFQSFDSPWAQALFAVCGIGIIFAGVFFGVARAERDSARRSSEEPSPMRTANQRLLERQARELQRKASDTRP